ncbi:hypothetical protein R1sor_013440 [Riccia sorocarpa]|uniref:EthD domain-containing protein n=1 Tax=Riccia sorocarpa TaxID=122646 RepID=A0ABD3HAN2_9MARC
MANQARLILLQPEGKTSDFDWIGKLTDAVSRSGREKITQIVERNVEWGRKLGYRLKPFTAALSIYSSDVEGLKELISTILKGNEVKDSRPVWLVGKDENKITKTPKDPSKPLAKFMGLLVRNPNLTIPQFHSHWSGPHAALFCSQPLSQEKVVIYNQFHCNPEWSKDFVQLGLSIAEFEGVVEICFDSVEDMEALFCSPNHVENVRPDEVRVLNLKKSGVLIGSDSDVTEKFVAAEIHRVGFLDASRL